MALNPTRISELNQTDPQPTDQIPMARGSGTSGRTYKTLVSDLFNKTFKVANSPTIDLNFDPLSLTLEANLTTAARSVSSLNTQNSPTVNLNWNPSTRTLSADVSTAVKNASAFNVVNSPTINLDWNASTRTLSAAAITSTLSTMISSSLSAAPFAAKAWVSFNGTGANGSKTPTSSYNVSSVTRFAAGRYKITFTDPLPSSPKVSGAVEIWEDTNRGMAFSILAREAANSYVAGDTSATTNYVWIQLTTVDSDPQNYDARMVTVIIF